MKPIRAEDPLKVQIETAIRNCDEGIGKAPRLGVTMARCCHVMRKLEKAIEAAGAADGTEPVDVTNERMRQVCSRSATVSVLASRVLAGMLNLMYGKGK